MELLWIIFYIHFALVFVQKCFSYNNCSQHYHRFCGYDEEKLFISLSFTFCIHCITLFIFPITSHHIWLHSINLRFRRVCFSGTYEAFLTNFKKTVQKFNRFFLELLKSCNDVSEKKVLMIILNSWHKNWNFRLQFRHTTELQQKYLKSCVGYEPLK